MNVLHTLSSGTAWMQIILSLSRCLSWLIVCVNLTAPHDAKYLVKHYLWVCPWRCFWKRLAFSALLSRLSKAYFPPPWQYIIQSIEVLFSSAQFSSSVVSNSLWPHKPHHARPPCPLATPGVHPNPCPSSRWCHPTISSSAVPSPPALNLSQHQGLFKWVSSSHQEAKVSEFQLQHQPFQWTPRSWIANK